jgi:bifunctional non-homologous end joining protein LigD
MPLYQIREPFDGDDWIFEIKYDGFRAVAYVENGSTRLVSRNGHAFRWCPALCESVGGALKCANAVLDGEIVCLDEDGRPTFNQLLYHRGEPHFYAFDLLWLDGKDLRGLPLLKRKATLSRLLARRQSLLLYADCVASTGVQLFSTVCEMDLEGIVAKWKHGTYRSDGTKTSWIKIKNLAYSQAKNRHERFTELRRAKRAASAFRARKAILEVALPANCVRIS